MRALLLVLIATLLIGCSDRQSADVRTPADFGAQPTSSNSGAKTPLDAISQWSDAIRRDGERAHQEFSVNQRDWAEDHWKANLANIVAMVQSDTFVLDDVIIEGRFAVCPIVNEQSKGQVCVVKTERGWHVLASVSDWSAADTDVDGVMDTLNRLNGQAMGRSIRSK